MWYCLSKYACNLVCGRAENGGSSWFVQSLICIFCQKKNIVTALQNLEQCGGKKGQALNNHITKYIIADYYEFHKGHRSYG